MVRLMGFAAALVLPLAFLLFLQWPLREALQAFSRQANDLAQIVFAIYVAVAVTAASRAMAHLSAHRPHADSGPATGGWRAWAVWLCVAPWAAFMLWSCGPQLWSATWGLEKFPETLTPGFFVIRLAMGLLLLLVLIDAFAALRRHKK